MYSILIYTSIKIKLRLLLTQSNEQLNPLYTFFFRIDSRTLTTGYSSLRKKTRSVVGVSLICIDIFFQSSSDR